jgi:hypothetical protein
LETAGTRIAKRDSRSAETIGTEIGFKSGTRFRSDEMEEG